MSGTGSGYDLSTTTFSPDGRVFQIEYATKAVEKSGMALGVRCVDGVVLGVEKMILTKMLVPGSNRRIHTIDLQSGLVMAGLAADGRQLVNKARAESKQYRNFWGRPIPGRVLNERIAGYMHTHTLYWYLRPFGCSVIMGSYDETPSLFMCEPSGVAYKYHAAAIGKHRQTAKTELEKIDFETITCREAVKIVAEIIYKLHNDIKDKDFELELSWVCDESNKRHVMVPKDIRAEAIELALEAKKKAEMDESDSEEEEKDN
jgi:20S proteasome subunit alpha 7